MQAARGASLNDRDQALFALVAGLAYVTDVATKVLAVEVLEGRPPVDVLAGFFSLDLTRNPGAAFSTATGYTPVLTAVAAVAAVVVVVIARRLGSTGWAVGLGLLLGGVLGNLTDRLLRSPGPFRGHVVDFFSFERFPVFNVADICINLAAAMIIIQAVRGVRVDGEPHRGEKGATGAGRT